MGRVTTIAYPSGVGVGYDYAEGRRWPHPKPDLRV